MATEPETYTYDPTAKTRLIIMAVLLPIAWTLSAVMVLVLLRVLPEHQVDDYAAWIIGAGIGTAALATLALMYWVSGDYEEV